MVYLNRMEGYGNIYHIIQKGKSGAFLEADVKLRLLSSIGAAREKYDFLFIGYCVMDNHYHLVLKTHNIPLSKIMQSVNTSFGKYYNKSYGLSPFKGRYKSIIIQEDKVLRLISLLHRKSIDYTSHAFYQMNVTSIVDIDYLLDSISLDRVAAIEEYSRVMEDVPEDYEVLLEEFSKVKKSIVKRKALEDILKEICPNQEDFLLIRQGSKKSYLMDYKRDFIKEARELGYSSKEIGDFINISDRAVRKHIHH